MVVVCAVSWLPVKRNVVGEKVTVTPGGIALAVKVTWSNPAPPRQRS
jgi:hypothetical protein